MKKLEGSPIRRIGYIRWLRNLAVGLGNTRRAYISAGTDTSQLDLALQARISHPSELVQEHIRWALDL